MAGCRPRCRSGTGPAATPSCRPARDPSGRSLPDQDEGTLMCAPLDQAPPTLADAIGRAHCWAEHALATPGHQVLSSVWWLSTHLAATERVVPPVAAETLADGRSRVAEQRRRAGEIVRL